MTAVLDDPDIRDKFALAHDNPGEFARLFCAITPTRQQQRLFSAVSRPGAKVTARSGHGIGKSLALAVIALWYLCTRKDAKIPCTAPTSHQLEDVLWSEIRRLHGRMPEWMRNQIHIGKERVVRDGSAGYIVARTARPERPEALQGFHGDELLFLIDEASGIDDAIFEVARGALSTPGARAVMTGNPTRLDGYFYNSFHLARDAWTRLHFSCLDSPRVDESYPREMALEYGEDSDMYRIRVLGEFPTQGLLSMIPADRVEAAMARALPTDALGNAPGIIGVDPAWMGSDRSVVFYRKSIWARPLFVGRGVDGERLATIVINQQEHLRPAATFVDKTGVGASVCDFLKSLGASFTPINFGGAPADPARFVNRRAEMWWAMREWFAQDVAVDKHPDLRDDLIGPEYGINGNGKIYLEKKDDMRKRGLASPDLADALALTFAAPAQMGRQAVRDSGYAKSFDEFRDL